MFLTHTSIWLRKNLSRPAFVVVNKNDLWKNMKINDLPCPVRDPSREAPLMIAKARLLLGYALADHVLLAIFK